MKNQVQNMLSNIKCCPLSIYFALAGYLLVIIGSVLILIAHHNPFYLLIVGGYSILVLILLTRVFWVYDKDGWSHEFSIDIHPEFEQVRI